MYPTNRGKDMNILKSQEFGTGQKCVLPHCSFMNESWNIINTSLEIFFPQPCTINKIIVYLQRDEILVDINRVLGESFTMHYYDFNVLFAILIRREKMTKLPITQNWYCSGYESNDININRPLQFSINKNGSLIVNFSSQYSKYGHTWYQDKTRTKNLYINSDDIVPILLSLGNADYFNHIKTLLKCKPIILLVHIAVSEYMSENSCYFRRSKVLVSEILPFLTEQMIKNYRSFSECIVCKCNQILELNIYPKLCKLINSVWSKSQKIPITQFLIHPLLDIDTLANIHFNQSSLFLNCSNPICLNPNCNDEPCKTQTYKEYKTPSTLI